MATVVPSLDVHTLVSLSKFVHGQSALLLFIGHTEKASEALLASLKRRHLGSGMLMLFQWTSLVFPDFIDPQK